MTSFIFCLWFTSTCKYWIIYEVSLSHWFVFSVFLPPPQITTGEGCTCRWRWMGECQEVMFRRLTVSVWHWNTQRFLFYMIHLIIRSQRGCNNWKELYYFYFKGTFSLSFYAFRCAGAEICQSRPRGLEGEVVIPVPLCGQCGPPERTGTVSTDMPNPKSLDLHVSACRHLTPHTSSPSFRGTTWRQTAPSESCCWQTDTPASCPRTTDLLCLWHPNSPPAVTRSPSHGSYRSGIPWQWRARLISHQTTRDFSTWTLTIFWGWLWIAWPVLSSQRKSEGN